MHTRHLRIAVAAAAVTVSLFAAPASAQRRGGIPVAPLPAEPVEYATGEGIRIRVTVLVRGLANPWSLAFLPDGAILVTENRGNLRLIRDGVLLPDPIAGVPAVQTGFLSGLLDVKLHPDFVRNKLVYLTYDKPQDDGPAVLAVARGVFDGRALTDVEDIFVAKEAGSVSRMLFAPDGKLYVSVYGAESGNDPQDPGQYDGKILRLNYDGSVPDDNPFVGRAGYLPEIYTMGHRSPEGLVLHEPTGRIWEVEMGPNGGDEINILEAGGNYGWPYVSMGRSYAGPFQPDKFHRDGMIDPVVFWMPSISTTGMTFYTGDRIAAWKGNIFVGGVRFGEIAGTGQLQRIVFNENMEEIRREALLTDLRHRIRDVRQGPDELLYVLTDDADGALLRIEPAD
jgi:glucose/arabinose dehydrogenase